MPNSDTSHCGRNAWQERVAGTPGRNHRPRKKPRRSDPTSSPPSLSDGGLPQKAFQSQSLNRAKTPYPGYYRHLNEIARERLGGLHSAKLLLWSFDFADVADLQQAGDWEGATALMIDAARRLEAGGAEALVICTNTMHRMASALETAVDLPLIHIADATAGRMKAAGAMRPALLATRFTMEWRVARRRKRQRNPYPHC